MYIAADVLPTVSRRFRAFSEMFDNQLILKYAKNRRFRPS